MSLSYWRSRQGGGILLILLATLTFAMLDSATHHITQLAPVLMLLWFRYAFQAMSTLVVRFPVQKTSLFATPNPKFQALRGGLLLISSLCSFFGLKHLPVGEFTALAMLSPMVATAMSAVVLKHPVARQRWILMLVGLIGVLLVIRPGGQMFGWSLLFPVLMVTTYAWFQVLTTRLSGDENPYTTHFYTGLVGMLVVAPAMTFSWSTQALLDYWPWFLTVGFFGTFGHLMLIRAFNRANAVVLSPYLYAQIAFATLAGWVFFSHAPDALAWAGIAVIGLSGVGNAALSIQEAKLKRQ
jgi:drug/metabolite transporter (DMT)-like permease